MAVDLAGEMLGYLVDVFSKRVVDAKGRPLKGLYVRQHGKRVLSQWGGFVGPAAAYLAATPFEGNPFHASEQLVRLAMEAGDRLLIDHAHITPKAKPNHFTLYPLAQLYEQVAEHADRKRLTQWRDLMARNLKAVDALIDRTWENLGKPGPWSGTGPNHFFGWFAVGYRQAKAAGRGVAGNEDRPGDATTHEDPGAGRLFPRAYRPGGSVSPDKPGRTGGVSPIAAGQGDPVGGAARGGISRQDNVPGPAHHRDL